MLGYVAAEGRGAGDRLIHGVAMRLRAQGLKLAGAVQVNAERAPDRKCDMDLHILAGAEIVRISQDLGRGSRGCRLDPAGLEQAVGLVAAALAARPALLIVNKFGKQELEGRGFRPVIGEAMAAGIPVLTAVNAGNLDGFLAWAETLAEPLPPDTDAILTWCLSRRAAA